MRGTIVGHFTSDESAEPTRKNTTRVDKVMVATFLEKGAHRRLKQLGLDQEKDVQELVYDALNLLFRSEGLPEMPPVERVKRGPKPR